jgi:hypothetical protein
MISLKVQNHLIKSEYGITWFLIEFNKNLKQTYILDMTSSQR